MPKNAQKNVETSRNLIEEDAKYHYVIYHDNLLAQEG